MRDRRRVSRNSPIAIWPRSCGSPAEDRLGDLAGQHIAFRSERSARVLGFRSQLRLRLFQASIGLAARDLYFCGMLFLHLFVKLLLLFIDFAARVTNRGLILRDTRVGQAQTFFRRLARAFGSVKSPG